MKIALVTDAWLPQVNGVVTTLVELVRELQEGGHEVVVFHPGQFRTRPCPGYAGIDLALLPGRALSRMLDAAQPDALPPRAHSAGRHGAIACAVACLSPPPFTPNSPKS